jgi:hypothetical protein
VLYRVGVLSRLVLCLIEAQNWLDFLLCRGPRDLPESSFFNLVEAVESAPTGEFNQLEARRLARLSRASPLD